MDSSLELSYQNQCVYFVDRFHFLAGLWYELKFFLGISSIPLPVTISVFISMPEKCRMNQVITVLIRSITSGFDYPSDKHIELGKANRASIVADNVIIK